MKQIKWRLATENITLARWKNLDYLRQLEWTGVSWRLKADQSVLEFYHYPSYDRIFTTHRGEEVQNDWAKTNAFILGPLIIKFICDSGVCLECQWRCDCRTGMAVNFGQRASEAKRASPGYEYSLSGTLNFEKLDTKTQ